jgi:hypothetical protein
MTRSLSSAIANAVALVGVTVTANAGVIPPDRVSDWSVAGYPGEVPRPATGVDATAFGATGDGTTNDAPGIAAAIASLKGAPGVVYLPAGNYRITSGLSLPSGVVLRGATPETAWIRCDLPNSGSTCISIAGTTTGGWRAVTGGLAKGSTSLTLADSTGIAAGDWIEIREANGSWDTKPATWATNVVGQIARVASVDGSAVAIEHPLRTTYDAALSPQVIKVVPKTDVGIEDLGIERVADPTPTAAGHNVQLSYATRCWVKGVHSDKSVGSHVGVYASTQLEVTGSYFHHGFTYDGTSTRGYGVTLNNHAGECLIEGNVFSHLRHAMMVKTGANGNVFAYNYSRDPYRSETINDFAGDISVHGHWPFANLFEGNVVANVIIDQYWGPAGPHNTFFRDREEWYGLIVSYDSPSNDQNFVGNEVMAGKSNILLFMYGLPYALKGSGHFAHGNNVSGSGVQPSGTGTLADASYYLPAGTDFCELAPGWPSIGVPNALGAGTVRAKQRWDAGGPMTYRELRVAAGQDASIEDGGSTVLAGEASGGWKTLSVTWSPATGLSDAHALQPTASPVTTTTYTLTATDANGCPRSDSVKVTVTGTAATPTFDPPPGTYLAAIDVAIACETPDATIRYTLDGSEPGESSAPYLGPIHLASSATIKARAFKVDFQPSDVAVADYAVDVDECALRTDDCDVHATCTNTFGGFTCACEPGWTGDGRACADVDECAGGAVTCVAHATCVNLPGAWQCVCEAGYHGATCVPQCGDGVPTPGEECDDGDGDDWDECTNACLTNPPGDRCAQPVALTTGAPLQAGLAGYHADLALVPPCAGLADVVLGPDAFFLAHVIAGRSYRVETIPTGADAFVVAARPACDGACLGGGVQGSTGQPSWSEFTAPADGDVVVQVVRVAAGSDGALTIVVTDVTPIPVEEDGPEVDAAEETIEDDAVVESPGLEPDDESEPVPDEDAGVPDADEDSPDVTPIDAVEAVPHDESAADETVPVDAGPDVVEFDALPDIGFDVTAPDTASEPTGATSGGCRTTATPARGLLLALLLAILALRPKPPDPEGPVMPDARRRRAGHGALKRDSAARAA